MKITAITNGPLLLEGQTVLVDQNGNAYARRDADKFSLCRCGASATKPFCDGTHAKNGFVSPPQADAPARAAPPTGAFQLDNWESEGGSVKPAPRPVT